MKNNLWVKAPLLRLAVSMMVGIVLGTYVPVGIPLWPVFVGILLVALLLEKYENLQSMTIILAFVMLGWVLVKGQWEKVRVDWPEGEVVYEAVVLTSPVEKAKTMAVDILLTGSGHKLKCYLHKDDRSRSLRIGDGLKIQSHIRPNSTWRQGRFDYRRYLEVHGYTGQTFVASWKWRKVQVSLKDLSRIERTRLFMLKQRSRLLHRLSPEEDTSLESPFYNAYAVVAAMALGDKSALSLELKETYAVTGASHVLALSGLHLSIIYMLLSLLVVNRRWQMFSQVFIVVNIWVFVFLVGMSVTVVRAAVMVSVYALLSLGHRDKMSVNTLAFTAIVMLIVKPVSLFDAGFQMSFAAVFAILVLVPLFDRVFPEGFLMSHRVVKWLWALVAVSLAAQIGTAPLAWYHFGRIPLWSVLTNVVVVPAAGLIVCLAGLTLLFPSGAYLLLYITATLNKILQWIQALVS
jgi:competence protein ComEC